MSMKRPATRRDFLAQAGIAAVLAGRGSWASAAPGDGQWACPLLGDLHFDRLAHHDMAWLEKDHPGDVRQVQNYSRLTSEVLPELFAVIKGQIEAATAAGLDALFEIHNEAELTRALNHGARIIGVNNRDLAIFKTDLGLSERLIPQFPRNVIAVSESGIFTPDDVALMRRNEVHTFLVGEAFMRQPDPGVELARVFA